MEKHVRSAEKKGIFIFLSFLFLVCIAHILYSLHHINGEIYKIKVDQSSMLEDLSKLNKLFSGIVED